MNPVKHLIVGASAAGMAAAHTIRACDGQGSVILLTDEKDDPYFRPMIPYLVSGQKTPVQMAMAGSGPYTRSRVQVKTGCRVDGVDTDARRVTLSNGQVLAYENILFATGSRAFVPDTIEGTAADGVFALRTLEDARHMADRARKTRHAVLLGGGLLNLKAAFALLERGIKVTLVVYSPQILSQLMEPEDAVLIRRALDEAGLKIRTKAAATAVISGTKGVEGVRLDDGSHMACQMVCIGKGVRPNVEFLEGSGIHVDKGVVADRFTRCSKPHTFAAGDVAVTHDPVSGLPVMTALWTNAVEMGRCAGRNMAGRPTAYSGTFGILNATQVAGLPFVSMGEVHTAGQDLEVHVRSSAASFLKLVFDPSGRRLVGTVMVGDIARAGLLRHVILGKMDTSGFKQQIIEHRLHWGHLAVR